MKASARIAEIRAALVEKELRELAAASGLEDEQLDSFRIEAMESERTGVAAIIAYLDEKNG